MEPSPPPDLASYEGEDIPRLVASLPRHSPVRQLAEAVLGRTHQALDSVQPLFIALSHAAGRSWKEQLVAAWLLGQVPLTPQEQDAAANMLLDILGSRPRRRLVRGMKQGMVRAYGLVLPVFLVVALFSPELPPDFLVHFLVLSTVASACLSLPLALWEWERSADHTNRLRAMAARTLGRLHVPESVGELAGAAFDRSPGVREAAAAALHEALPTLTDAHYGMFGAQSVENLGKVLSHPNSLLVSQTLDALRKVGTSHALPYVEQVAAQGRTVRLRDKADEVLGVLRVRQQQEAEAQTLLRAGIAPPIPAQHLLRPAQGVGNTEPQQLLRASDSEYP